MVMGGGPAGCAAAITAAKKELEVILLERSTFPRPRPGETFHPGAEALFRQLGILDQVLALNPIRHAGHIVEWAGRSGFETFGHDGSGVWRGFQILREEFDQILIDRASKLGVRVMQPATVKNLVKEEGMNPRVQWTGGEIEASLVVDATGKSRWARRKTNRQLITVSPSLVARYGYVKASNSVASAPKLTSQTNGWTWQAPVSRTLTAWTRLYYDADLARGMAVHDSLPDASKGAVGRGADVSWSLVWPPAASQVYAVGEAAMSLDPLSSHGNLQAMMSGIFVGHIASAIVAERGASADLEKHYGQWISHWLLADCEKVLELYNRLKPDNSWIYLTKSKIEYLKNYCKR